MMSQDFSCNGSRSRETVASNNTDRQVQDKCENGDFARPHVR